MWSGSKLFRFELGWSLLDPLQIDYHVPGKLIPAWKYTCMVTLNIKYLTGWMEHCMCLYMFYCWIMCVACAEQCSSCIELANIAIFVSSCSICVQLELGIHFGGNHCVDQFLLTLLIMWMVSMDSRLPHNVWSSSLVSNPYACLVFSRNLFTNSMFQWTKPKSLEYRFDGVERLAVSQDWATVCLGKKSLL